LSSIIQVAPRESCTVGFKSCICVSENKKLIKDAQKWTHTHTHTHTYTVERIWN